MAKNSPEKGSPTKGAQAKKNSTAAPKSSSKGSSKSAPKKAGIFKRIATYFHSVRLEIKRTTWPTRDEVLRMSLIVVGALIFFGVFIFVADWVMTNLLNLYSALVSPDKSITGGQ